MQDISNGNESTVDLTSFVQLLVDGVNNSKTLSSDAEVGIEVQLGTAANPLANGGSDLVAIYAKVTSIDTGDEANKPNEASEVKSTIMLITGKKRFWVKSGSIIKVFAKSTGSDSSVGTKVWLTDFSSSGGDATEAKQDTIIDWLEADQKVDDSNPAQFQKVRTKTQSGGGGAEISRKDINDVDGNPIINLTTVFAEEVEP